MISYVACSECDPAQPGWAYGGLEPCPPCNGRGKVYAEGAYTPIVHASDVAVMRQCLRKWHGVLVQGQREPSGEATERGTAIHAILEHYLDTGEPIDTTTHYGRIAASGLRFLPPVQSGVTEQHFRLFGPIVNGEPLFAYYGAIDWVHKAERKVKDHKTTSNFKYQKTEATLRKDAQVIVYGSYCAETRPGTDIEFEWIYYRTAEKGARKAQSTLFVMTEEELAAAKAELDQEILRSISYRRLPFLELPPTASACFAYGRPCHLKYKCADVKPKIGDLFNMSITKDALLADLKAKGLGGSPPGVPVPPPLPSVTAPAAATPAVPGLPSIPSLPGVPALSTPAPSAAAGLPSVPGLPSIPSLPGAPATTATAAAPSVPSLPVLGAPPALPAVTPPAIDPAIMALAAAEGKAKVKADKTLTTSEAKAATVAAHGPATAIGTLYVDCLPLQEEVTPFSVIAAHCHAGIKDTTGLIHYRMAEFGKGPALWCEAVKMYASAMPCASLYLDTTAGDGRDALEVLLTLAGRVVRGVK